MLGCMKALVLAALHLAQWLAPQAPPVVGPKYSPSDLVWLDTQKLPSGERFPRRRLHDFWPELGWQTCPPSTPWTPLAFWLQDLQIQWSLAFGQLVWLPLPRFLQVRMCFPGTRELDSKPAGQAEWSGGVLVETVCGVSGCEDSLAIDGRWRIRPTAGRQKSGEEYHRYVRVAGGGTEYTSVVVAEQSYSDGAAHYNYRVVCRTYAKNRTAALRLRDLLGLRAERALLDNALKVLYPCGYFEGAHVPCSSVPSGAVETNSLGPEDFRVETDQRGAPIPRIVLCTPGDYWAPVLELPIDELPATILLR